MPIVSDDLTLSLSLDRERKTRDLNDTNYRGIHSRYQTGARRTVILIVKLDWPVPLLNSKNATVLTHFHSQKYRKRQKPKKKLTPDLKAEKKQTVVWAASLESIKTFLTWYIEIRCCIDNFYLCRHCT